jgi:hypothetical protein
MISTPVGIHIVSSAEQSKKALAQIRESLDGVSKTTSRRAVHNQKHCGPMLSTQLGIAIDDNDEQFEKTSDSIRARFEGV